MGLNRTFVFATLLAACSSSFGQIVVTSRVSVDSAGNQGNNYSSDNQRPAISADGRYVAFNSHSNNLVPGDNNGTWDVFRHDRWTGQTIRVSVSSEGVEGNGGSDYPSISDDGRYIAFHSSASNLVSGPDLSGVEVFVHDCVTGETAKMSVSSNGDVGNMGSIEPSISGNGRYVAFRSYASNLVPNDWNGVDDVFVHDRLTGQTVRANVSSSGQQTGVASGIPSMNGDGRYVTFESPDGGLVPGDTNGQTDIFVRDLLTQQTTRASVSSAGGQGNGYASGSWISADGRYVVFHSASTNLDPNDTNGKPDLYLRDLQAGTTSRVSLDANGVQGNGESIWATLSGDGRFMAFMSDSSNLVVGDTNGTWDSFLKDLQTGRVTRLSVSTFGAQGNGMSLWPAISDDANFVAYESVATNLVPNDTNGFVDVFVGALNTEPEGTVYPSSYAVTEGFEADGNLQSLFFSDDARLTVFNDDLTLGVEVVFFATAPTATPTELHFLFEGAAYRRGLAQTLRLRNFATGQYVVVDGRVAPTTDESVDVQLTSNASEYVGSGRALRARVNWSPINDEAPAQDGWIHGIDVAKWRVQ